VVRVVDGDRLGFGINNPRRPTAGGEPVLDFGNYLTRPIAGRENLHRQIRSTGEETARQPLADAIGEDKGHVGRKNRVGIGGNPKAGFRPQNDSQATWFHEVPQNGSHFSRYCPMLRSGGRHHDELSTHKFAPPEVRRLKQLFGGRDVFSRDHEQSIPHDRRSGKHGKIDVRTPHMAEST